MIKLSIFINIILASTKIMLRKTHIINNFIQKWVKSLENQHKVDNTNYVDLLMVNQIIVIIKLKIKTIYKFRGKSNQKKKCKNAHFNPILITKINLDLKLNMINKLTNKKVLKPQIR